MIFTRAFGLTSPKLTEQGNFFRQLEFLEILLISLRRKFETNQGKPSVDSVRKVRKEGLLPPGNAILGQPCKI